MVPCPEMLAYTKERLLRLLKIDFIRFCTVGGLGFVINFALLFLLHSLLGVHAFVSQLIAAEVALLCNFMLHHAWTYKRHHVTKPVRLLLVQFHATSWPAIIGSATLVSLGVMVLRLQDLTALALSSAIALGWNFFWSKYVIWKDVSKEGLDKLESKGR